MKNRAENKDGRRILLQKAMLKFLTKIISIL